MAQVEYLQSVDPLEPFVLDDHRIRIGDLILDLRERVLGSSHGRSLKLSTNEFAILATLCKTPGRFVDREYLLGVMAIGSAQPQPSVVDTFVGQLRRRMQEAGTAATIEKSPSNQFRLCP